MPNQAPMTVKIKKDALLEKLRENKGAHRANYDTAMKSWRKEIAEAAKKVVAEAEEGTLKSMGGNYRHTTSTHPLSQAINDEPANHLESYTTTIEMFEMCEDETIVMGHTQFRCLLVHHVCKRIFASGNVLR